MPGEGRQEEMRNGKKGNTEGEEREDGEGREGGKMEGRYLNVRVIRFNKNK